MKSQAPPLLPIFRSRGQAELLALVLLSSSDERSLTQLAAQTKLSLATVQREVSRFEEAGVVVSRRVGNVRLVRSAETRDAELLAELLLRSFGPRQVVTEELARVEGIDQVVIFGSWAARYLGERGHAPNDLDLLILGSPDQRQLARACLAIGRRIGREVNTVQRDLTWWTSGSDDPLIREIKRRPHLIV
jgi:DNA-binding transcriptional ArsR family regulator